MKAKALRELLQTVDDDVEVVIPQDLSTDPRYSKTMSVREGSFFAGSDGIYYDSDDFLFPPIDRVNVIIIQ